MTNATIDKAFSVLALLRVEETSTPFSIKVKGSKGQISVPLGTDMTPVLGLGVTIQQGRFVVLYFNA